MKTVDREKLWGEYQKNPSSALREKLITEYAPLVKVVAGRLSMYLGYNVEYEDLVSYGIFGLIDAIDKFDPGKDVKFETYAEPAYPRFHSGSDPQDGLDTKDCQTEAEAD